MLCSRSLNCILKEIHIRALRLIYNYHVISFENLLQMPNEKSIHPQQNIEVLAEEKLNFVNGLATPAMSYVLFTLRKNTF